MHRKGTVRPKAPPGAPPKPPPPPKGQRQQPPRHVSQPVSRRQLLAPRPLQQAQPFNTHAASPNDTLPGVPGTPASPGTPSHDPSTPNHGPIDAGFGERPSVPVAASSRRIDDPVLPFKVGTRRVVNRGPSGPVSRQTGGAGPSVRPVSSTQPSPSAPTTVHGAHKSVAPPRSPPVPYAKSPTNGPRGGGGGGIGGAPVPAPPPPQPQQQPSAPSPWPLAAHQSNAPVSEGSGGAGAGAGSSRSVTPAASLSHAGRSLPAEEPVVALNPVSTVSGCLIIENMSVALLDGGSDAAVMAEMKAALREDFATALRHPVSLVSVDSIGGHPLAVCLSVHLTDGMSRVDVVGKLQQLMQNAGYAKGDAHEAAASGGGRRVLVLPCTSRVYSEHTGRFTPEVVFAGDLSWFVAQPAPDANMRVGHRVVRHAAHWMWGDQDGGEGGEGTVVDCDVAGGWAVVRWDCSSEANKYRWGPVSGAYDLRVVGSEDAGAGGGRPQSTSPPDRSSSAASQPSSQPHITPPRQPTAAARAALAAQQLQQQLQQQQPVAEQPQAPRPPPPPSPPAGIGLGARVRRNPIVWDESVYGAPDGGRGGLGTIVKITGESWTLGDDGRPQSDTSMYVCVSWDHEARARGVTSASEAAKTGRMYRWGVEGVFDVVVDASPADPVPAPAAPAPPPQTLPQTHPQPQPVPARSPLGSNQAVRCVQVTVLSSRGVPTVTSKVQASFESELPEQTSVWRGPDPSWGETLALDVPPGVATNLSGRMLRVLLLGSPSDRADLMMPVGGCEIELGHLVGPSSQTLWIAVDPSMQSRLVASPSAPGRSLQTATSPDATCWLRISLGFVFVQLQPREPEDVPSRPAYHSWPAAAETYPQATPAPAAAPPAAYPDPALRHRGGVGGRDMLSAVSPYSPSAPPAAAPRTPGGGYYAAAPQQHQPPPPPPVAVPPVDSERAMSPGRGRPWPVDMTVAVAHSDNVRREESYVGHHAQRRSVHAPQLPAPSSPAHAPAQTHLRMREVQPASQQPAAAAAAAGPAARRALSPRRRSRGSGDVSHPTSPSLAPAQAPQAPAPAVDPRSDSAAAFHAHQARSIQTPNRRGLSPTRPHAPRGSAQLSPSSAPSSAPHYVPHHAPQGGGGGGAPIYSGPPLRASSSRHSSVAAHHPPQQQPVDLLRFGLPQQQQQQPQALQYPPSAASVAPSTPRAAAASGPPAAAAAALFADGLDGSVVAPADGDATSAVEYLVQLNFDPVTVLEVARLLKQQHVDDVGTLRLLSEPDLRAIGVPLGCRRRITTALNLGLGR